MLRAAARSVVRVRHSLEPSRTARRFASSGDTGTPLTSIVPWNAVYAYNATILGVVFVCNTSWFEHWEPFAKPHAHEAHGMASIGTGSLATLTA